MEMEMEKLKECPETVPQYLHIALIPQSTVTTICITCFEHWKVLYFTHTVYFIFLSEWIAVIFL